MCRSVTEAPRFYLRPSGLLSPPAGGWPPHGVTSNIWNCATACLVHFAGRRVQRRFQLKGGCTRALPKRGLPHASSCVIVKLAGRKEIRETELPAGVLETGAQYVQGVPRRAIPETRHLRDRSLTPSPWCCPSFLHCFGWVPRKVHHVVGQQAKCAPVVLTFACDNRPVGTRHRAPW